MHSIPISNASYYLGTNQSIIYPCYPIFIYQQSTHPFSLPGPSKFPSFSQERMLPSNQSHPFPTHLHSIPPYNEKRRVKKALNCACLRARSLAHSLTHSLTHLACTPCLFCPSPATLLKALHCARPSPAQPARETEGEGNESCCSRAQPLQMKMHTKYPESHSFSTRCCCCSPPPCITLSLCTKYVHLSIDLSISLPGHAYHLCISNSRSCLVLYCIACHPSIHSSALMHTCVVYPFPCPITKDQIHSHPYPYPYPYPHSIKAITPKKPLTTR